MFKDSPPPTPGADPGGGGYWVSGPSPPPSPFWGTPKLHSEGKKTSRVYTGIRRVLVVNSYPDPPPFWKSCIRPCTPPPLARSPCEQRLPDTQDKLISPNYSSPSWVPTNKWLFQDGGWGCQKSSARGGNIRPFQQTRRNPHRDVGPCHVVMSASLWGLV